jgi:hypothetical protein
LELKTVVSFVLIDLWYNKYVSTLLLPTYFSCDPRKVTLSWWSKFMNVHVLFLYP